MDKKKHSNLIAGIHGDLDCVSCYPIFIVIAIVDFTYLFLHHTANANKCSKATACPRTSIPMHKKTSLRP